MCKGVFQAKSCPKLSRGVSFFVDINATAYRSNTHVVWLTFDLGSIIHDCYPNSPKREVILGKDMHQLLDGYVT